MAVTAKRASALALSLAGTTTYPHFHRLAFRVPRRTFATLGLDDNMNLMFDLEHQARFCKLAPLAIAPVPGGWGRMGWTSCDLKKIDAETFASALKAAHALANVPRIRGASKAGASKAGASKAGASKAGASKAGASKAGASKSAVGRRRAKKST